MGDKVLDIVESDVAFVLNVKEGADVAGGAFAWGVAGVFFVLVLDAGDDLDEVVGGLGFDELGKNLS